MRPALELKALVMAVALASLAASFASSGLAAGTPCPERHKCTGCGCKGGPGYRDLGSGKCVGFKELEKRCGSPPDAARCRFENAPGTGENYWCALDLNPAAPNPFMKGPGD